MKAKAKKMQYDGLYRSSQCYVRAWIEDGQTIGVQVWIGCHLDKKPDGNWLMPKKNGLKACIDQAVMQTPR